MGLDYQVCYNGGAQGTKCKQRRLSQQEMAIGATHLKPPPAGENLKKTKIIMLLDHYTNLNNNQLELALGPYSLSPLMELSAHLKKTIKLCEKYARTVSLNDLSLF